MKHVLWVTGRLPALNEMLDGASRVMIRVRGSHKRVTRYSDAKKSGDAAVVLAANTQLRGVTWDPGYLTLLLVCKDRHRDPSNLAAGARKCVLDGLQKAGVIPGDGWSWDLGGAYHPCLDKVGPEGVLVAYSALGPESLPRMRRWLGEAEALRSL